MIDIQTYGLFVATAAVLVLSPGRDMVLVLSRTIASGTSAGLMTLASITFFGLACRLAVQEGR